MWTVRTAPTGRAVRYQVFESGLVLSWQQMMERWREPDFAVWFSAELAAAEFPAFFWECPPITDTDLDQPFEFVLVNSPGLAGVAADSGPFAKQFYGDELAVGFHNLGRDAYLVAPTPTGNSFHCPHLADFVRGATSAALHALWAGVSDALHMEVDDDKLWLSTSGLGVYWVHIRLDRRPKYYTHGPYRAG